MSNQFEKKMKTIGKYLFLITVVGLALTGCQKQSDEIDVSLKAAIAFEGGYYETDWQSGDAEAECALAGGCSGLSYKMDHGLVEGITYYEDVIKVEALSSQSFKWSSEVPVCKIIVKAGRGAYVYNIGNAIEGTIVYPEIVGLKTKDISHITFCFGLPEIITVKVIYQDATNTYWGVSAGTVVFTSLWCGQLGVNPYPFTEPIKLIKAYTSPTQPGIGYVTIIDNKIKITLNPGLTLVEAHIYLGTEADLIDPDNLVSFCPDYENDWILYVDWDPGL